MIFVSMTVYTYFVEKHSESNNKPKGSGSGKGKPEGPSGPS